MKQSATDKAIAAFRAEIAILERCCAELEAHRRAQPAKRERKAKPAKAPKVMVEP